MGKLLSLDFDYSKEQFMIKKPDLVVLGKILTKNDFKCFSVFIDKVERNPRMIALKHGFRVLLMAVFCLGACFLFIPVILVFFVFLFLVLVLIKKKIDCYLYGVVKAYFKHEEASFNEFSELVYLDLLIENKPVRGRSSGFRMRVWLMSELEVGNLLLSTDNILSGLSFLKKLDFDDLGTSRLLVESTDRMERLETDMEAPEPSKHRDEEQKISPQKKPKNHFKVLSGSKQRSSRKSTVLRETPSFKANYQNIKNSKNPKNQISSYEAKNGAKEVIKDHAHLKLVLNQIEINVAEEQKKFIEIGKMEKMAKNDQNLSRGGGPERKDTSISHGYISSINRESVYHGNIDESQISKETPKNILEMITKQEIIARRSRKSLKRDRKSEMEEVIKKSKSTLRDVDGGKRAPIRVDRRGGLKKKLNFGRKSKTDDLNFLVIKRRSVDMFSTKRLNSLGDNRNFSIFGESGAAQPTKLSSRKLLDFGSSMNKRSSTAEDNCLSTVKKRYATHKAQPKQPCPRLLESKEVTLRDSKLPKVGENQLFASDLSQLDQSEVRNAASLLPSSFVKDVLGRVIKSKVKSFLNEKTYKGHQKGLLDTGFEPQKSSLVSSRVIGPLAGITKLKSFDRKLSLRRPVTPSRTPKRAFTVDMTPLRRLERREDLYPCQTQEGVKQFKSDKGKAEMNIAIEGSFNFDVKFSKIE